MSDRAFRDIRSEILRRRAQNRRVQRERAEAARIEEKLERRHVRNQANARRAECHLTRRIERIERHPSPLALAQLREIATAPDTPPLPRALAAGIVLRWTDGVKPKPPKARRGKISDDEMGF